MNNFYRAVEGKTFRGLPVYKFTGERLAMVDRSECDFDGCEFVAERDSDTMFSTITIHPDSLPMMRDRLDGHLWHWLIDSPNDVVPANGVRFYAGEFECALGTNADDHDLQLDWPFGSPTKFYEAVEGKTHLGLPVYRFTGERLGAISNQECNFDGCEFVALKDRFTDDRLIVICHLREGWDGQMTFYAGDLDPCHDPYGTFELDWPEFRKPANPNRMYRCVNCGEHNPLGDCCPACAAFDCDVCGEKIDFDGDVYCEETDRRMCLECADKEGVSVD